MFASQGAAGAAIAAMLFCNLTIVAASGSRAAAQTRATAGLGPPLSRWPVPVYASIRPIPSTALSAGIALR